jgi:hypothetical protein
MATSALLRALVFQPYCNVFMSLLLLCESINFHSNPHQLYHVKMEFVWYSLQANVGYILVGITVAFYTSRAIRYIH